MSANIEWTFNVQNDCQAFVTRINDLRYQLRDRARAAPLYDNLYMLRPYTSRPRQWLRARLQDGSTEITVWVRTDNLYFVGFQGSSTWEFGRSSNDEEWRRQRLLSGSKCLGFEGGYTGSNLGDLIVGPSPEELRELEERREQPPRRDLGLQQLVDAIRGLAYYQGGGVELRSWLRTIALTISESIRSQQVSSYVGDLLRGGSSGWLTHKLICIIRNWEKVSLCLILSANDPDIPGLCRCLREKGVCGNTHEARQVVAIVYHGPATRQQQQQAPRQRRAVCNDGGTKVDDVATGLTFVEVLGVEVDSGGEDRCDLYGTATLDDGLNPVDVFRREWSNTQSLGTRGSAEMIGPSRAIWGYDEVVFDLDLLSGTGTVSDMSPDDQISKGQVVWNAHQKPESDYNTPKECTVEGESGAAATIRYAVLTDAVVATVTVVLPDGDDHSDPDLYGSIMGWTSALYQHKMPLFKTERKDCVSLYAGDTIPLLRTVVVVPRGSKLYVEADLWDQSVLPDTSPDDHIADNRAWFEAKLSAVENKEISGPNGHVTVYVTWSRT